MKITFHEYNSFVIEHGGKTVVIDPGATMFYKGRFLSLVPREVWPDVTHIFVTHGDPDHYWFADKMADVSGAPVVLDSRLIRDVDGTQKALGPRTKGLGFSWEVPNPAPVEFGQTRMVDGISVTTVTATHGPLSVKLGPFTKTETPGPHERIGWNAVGFQMNWDGKSIVNLGDTLLELEAWKEIRSPDVLMLPIGGETVGNTMGVVDAVKAVDQIRPGLVIPTHFNMRAFFSTDFCPADGADFKRRVEDLGVKCAVMERGESLVL